MSTNLTVLVSSMDGVGHVNACIGLAQVLQKRGHKIVFVANQIYRGKLAVYGFEEEIIEKEESGDKKPGEEAAKMLLKTGILSGKSSIEKIKLMSNMDLSRLVDTHKQNLPKYEAIVAKHKPDVFIIDDIVGSPAFIFNGKPWVAVFSANPLAYIDDNQTPPGFSGYSVNGDRNNWDEFRRLKANVFEKTAIKYNEWLKQLEYKPINCNRSTIESPYLNIYGFPQELDYDDIRPVPMKWMRIDAFLRKEPKEFKIPEKLQKRDKHLSKLIYLSMGSMGCIDVNLMKRFVDILAKTSHKYIISKGHLHDKYDLADNMWGEASVPQTNVLPLVDLVITHGGNNSVTETFSFGKPMIVMPLFADQFDNAQRIHDKGYGIRLDPYLFSDHELLNSIEILLNDKQLDERLSIASKRMLNSDSIHKACERIESLLN